MSHWYCTTCAAYSEPVCEDCNSKAEPVDEIDILLCLVPPPPKQQDAPEIRMGVRQAE